MKHLTKFIAVVLVFILAFTPLSVFTAGAVEYPDGITQTQTESVIPKLNSLLKTLMNSSGEETDIKNTLYETLYKDETINSLFAEIYTALGENADSLSVIGVDVSPAALAKALSSYSSVSEKVAACSDLNEVISVSKDFKWEVSSKTAFGKAIAAIISPFNSLLNALLCSGTVEINSFLAIQGDDGYTAAIVPLLQALDCPDIMTSAAFSEAASKNKNNIIRNIISMAFSAVDKLLEDPVIGMCETLPKLAYYLNSGKLSDSITSLLEPLSLKIAGIFTIPGISDLITGATDIEGSVNLNEMLEEIDLSEMLGSDVKLQIPEINLANLAECVTDNGGSYTVDSAAAFIVIMDFVIETLKLNKDSLGALMGGSDMSGILDPLLSKSNSEIIKTIITLFSITSAPQNNYQWNYPAVTPTAVTYTPTLTANDYLGYLDKVDPLLTDFVKESDPEGTIEDTLRKTIYSNSLVSQLVIGIFSAIGSEETAPLFALLGMDVSPSGIADTIYSYYPYTARQLYNYSSWERVNPNYLSWGFYDGDSEGFVKAVTRVLTPFIPLLSCVLAGQNVTVMDAVTIPGSDGYNTAIIPLLEALGCNSEDIMTYSEYQKGAGTSAILTDILKPVTALLDRICESPVKTLCSILPNIVYFFNSGLMNGVTENLLYPVKYMLETAGLGDLLTSAFSETGAMDLNSLVGELTSGADLGIKLPELDITVIGTLGNATTLTSKRVASGTFAQYTYLTADSPAVFLTILRYLVSAISMEENSGLLTGLMGSSEGSSAEGMPDMFSMYAGNITEKFKDMTNDEIIEWLCDLLFSESPIVEIPVENEEIPTIIYEKKFELSTTAKLIIVFAVIALLALLYYILSVTGRLDNLKLKSRKRKEIKRRKKESKKLIKGGGVAVEAMENTPKKEKSSKKEAKAAEKTEAVPDSSAKPVNAAASSTVYTEEALKILAKNAEKEEKPKSEKAVARREKSEKANDTKADRIAKTKLPDEKASEKLMRRKLSAEKKARKNELKIQKHYAKAKKQAEKKNKK